MSKKDKLNIESIQQIARNYFIYPTTFYYLRPIFKQSIRIKVIT
jgi:hypothetical protein